MPTPCKPLTPQQEAEARRNLDTLPELLGPTPAEVTAILGALLTGPDGRRIAEWLAEPHTNPEGTPA